MKIINYLLTRFQVAIFQKPRIIKYRYLSNVKHLSGKSLAYQPLLLTGLGSIDFGQNVIFGVLNSPGFYNGVNYLESRSVTSKIVIGNNVWFNNNFTAISDGGQIIIGDDSLIGFNVVILDSDFHSLNPQERRSQNYSVKDVIIGKNVFIGANVIILKGVTIGDNCVIGSGSIVTKSFPNDVIIGGNPAVLINKLQ